MADLDEDCGCTSGNGEVDLEKVKETMESTRDSLNQMFDTLQNMSFDFTQFNNIEQEVKKMNDYMYSGEFVKTMGGALKEANLDMNQIIEMQKRRMPPTSPYMKAPSFTPKPKQPIGYVWIDENGEQKFSVIAPEDVTAMPVYAE